MSETVIDTVMQQCSVCVTLYSASELVMKTESLLASSPQKSGRHDVTLNTASHSVIRIPPRHSGPAYDVIAILDPATRAAQKYTPVIMVGVFSYN